MTTTTHTTVPVKTYLLTFLALMALLGLTIAAGYVNFGELNLPIAMLISAAKTVLIILFFMHVRYGSKLIKLVACVGFAWLAILLSLAMNDYVSRGWEKIQPSSIPGPGPGLLQHQTGTAPVAGGGNQ